MRYYIAEPDRRAYVFCFIAAIALTNELHPAKYLLLELYRVLTFFPYDPVRRMIAINPGFICIFIFNIRFLVMTLWSLIAGDVFNLYETYIYIVYGSMSIIFTHVIIYLSELID